MTRGIEATSTSKVIEELEALARSRHLTGEAKEILTIAAERLRETHELPVYLHRSREGSYAVVKKGVEVQTSRPIQEGDTLTCYREDSGKWYARLDSEFEERFRLKG